MRRPMSQWVEEEIVLPNGPFADQRYRHARHPASRLWFSELESGRWQRFAATGPTQNGKTLMCYVAPVLYHLFEIGETVIVGLPDMAMANDKWKQDFLPVINASRYKELLPTKGEGSRGGSVKSSITFTNGATLRFMSAGGGDKKRSAFTSRVVAITETDGMDEAGETSREADKIEQIEARTMAFERTGKAVYLECTVSIERGRIWQEITNGSDSKIARPCPHCCVYVTPEREHLSGWQDAESEEEAKEKAFFACPECGEAWSEDEIIEAAKSAVLVHKGQEVTAKGEVVGPLPKTQTLGFRWSAIDNPFTTPGHLGVREWKAAKAWDRENEEKKMRQFIWALPYEPPDVELTPLDPAEVSQRVTTYKQRECPPETVAVSVGVDTGKRALHWTAFAVDENGGGQVIEYGVQPTEADKLGMYRGLLEALGLLKQYLAAGYGSHHVSQVWIDSGYFEHTDPVYAFCESAGYETFKPTKGHGEKQKFTTKYTRPDGKHKDLLFMGAEYHITKLTGKRLQNRKVPLVHVNADHWKSVLHDALAMPEEQAGAVRLYEVPTPNEHAEFVRHLTAEKQVESFDPLRGTLITWERLRRENHWLDSTYAALCAGHYMLANREKQKRTRERVSLGSMGK